MQEISARSFSKREGVTSFIVMGTRCIVYQVFLAVQFSIRRPVICNASDNMRYHLECYSAQHIFYLAEEQTSHRSGN